MRYLVPLVIAALAAGCQPGQSEIPIPEKIVFILADDIGAEWFGPYGNTSQETPSIDRLANSGFVFENFTALPLCSPTRQVILTGTHQHHRYEHGWTMPGDTPTFLQILDQQGFKSGVYGKWHGFDPKTAFTEFKVDDYVIYNDGKRRFWSPQTNENGVVKEYGETVFGPDIYNAKLLDFLTENKDEKFFAYYSMALSHWPFVTTPDSVDKNETDWQKNFTDMVDYTDKMVGKVIDHLEGLGINDETLIIFAADNGTYPDLIAELASGDFIKGGKSYPLQSGERVPFIAYYGDYFKHTRVQDVADFKDIFPSLMDIAGVTELPERYDTLDGESLIPLLFRGEPRQTRFSLAYFEGYTGREDMRALHVRNQAWKLYSDGRLVDLQNDPLEYNFTTGLSENEEQKTARVELQNELDRLRETDADYRTVEAMLDRENGKTIASWTPSQVSIDEIRNLTVDLTPFVDERESYTIGIQHFMGSAGVEVSNVTLLMNGKPIATDKHVGRSEFIQGLQYQYAIQKENIYFELDVEASLAAGSKYELSFDTIQITEGDSYGVIKLLPENFVDPAQPFDFED